MRNALAYANKNQRQMVLALINTAFAQETPEAAHEQWDIVVDHFRSKLPKLAAMLDKAEHEVLSFIDFPRSHRKQIASDDTWVIDSSVAATLYDVRNHPFQARPFATHHLRTRTGTVLQAILTATRSQPMDARASTRNGDS